MDGAMEDIIKNIIHIDKSAVKLKEDLEGQINERRKQANDEIIHLKEKIVQTEKYKMDELKNEEMHKARDEADAIVRSTKAVAASMYEKYKQNEENFIKDMFKEIFYK
jgi:hypothetical protein